MPSRVAIRPLAPLPVHGSPGNEHLHFHCLVTDGLFAPAEHGGAEFHQAAGIDEARIDRLTDTLRRRILRYLVRQDLIDDQVALDMAGWDHHGGFSLDAAVRVEAWDRMALERLARYCALCRYRHKAHYSDFRIIPRSMGRLRLVTA